jgi:hypothetical protein
MGSTVTIDKIKLKSFQNPVRLDRNRHGGRCDYICEEYIITGHEDGEICHYDFKVCFLKMFTPPLAIL